MLMEAFTRVPGRPRFNPCPIGARNSPLMSALLLWRSGREGWIMNVGMSSTVTDSIRESVRDMAIGKINSNEKADRAIVEQAFSIMQQNLTGRNWQSRSTRLRCWCSIIYNEDTRFQCNVEEDVIRITSGKDTGDMYYKTITGLHKALAKEDANAIEKPTNPGDSTKAKGISLCCLVLFQGIVIG